MLLVPCPHCGPRNASDLHLVGEVVSRPDPATTTREAWSAYLYLRENPAGWVAETWYCRMGCRRYFTLSRNRATNEFRPGPLPGAKLGAATYTHVTVGSAGEQTGRNAPPPTIPAALDEADSNGGETTP